MVVLLHQRPEKNSNHNRAKRDRQTFYNSTICQINTDEEKGEMQYTIRENPEVRGSIIMVCNPI
jgi:hypothetical protein